MKDESRNESRKDFFEKHGAGWEARNYPPEKREQVERMVGAFSLCEGERVLDVGCGEGILFPYLREYIGRRGEIVALDPSEGMLRGAAQKSEAFIIKADAEHIPLIAHYIDQVICFAAFPHISDKEQAAREFFRVLRPRGKAFVAHLMNREELAAHHAKHHGVRGDCLPCFDEMKRIFADAGFSRIHLDERSGWYLLTAEKGES